MLDLLAGGERAVVELSAPFRMSQPAISQHLRVLRRAGLVRMRPAGRRTLYRIEPAPLAELFVWAEPFRRLMDPSGHAWAIGSSQHAAAGRARRKADERKS